MTEARREAILAKVRQYILEQSRTQPTNEVMNTVLDQNHPHFSDALQTIGVTKEEWGEALGPNVEELRKQLGQ